MGRGLERQDKGFPLPEGECWALSCPPLDPAQGLLGHLTAPTEPVPWLGDMGTCVWRGGAATYALLEI